MSERVFIKPKPGRKPVFPRSSDPVPEAGCEVNLSTYWIRRQQDGDLEISDVTPAPAPRAKRGAAAVVEE